MTFLSHKGPCVSPQHGSSEIRNEEWHIGLYSLIVIFVLVEKGFQGNEITYDRLLLGVPDDIFIAP